MSNPNDDDSEFLKGWKQGVHEAVTSLLDVLQYDDLREEWRFLEEYLEMRRRRAKGS